MTTAANDLGLQLNQQEIRLAGAVLISLDTHIAPGEVLTVMGPSGSGKSTLLAAIAGTLAPDFIVTGGICLDGRELGALPPQQRHVGLMFQDDLLFPNLSVAGNLLFAIPASVKGRQARRTMAELALAQAGLEGFANRDPATLSGGQRARVALMRMLLAAPHALLLDEPFAKLDTPMRMQFRELVFELARGRGLPVLLVTHDSDDARAAGGAVVSPTGTPIQL
jgi:putative thiamine transport system ATP-binding protein